MIDQQVLDRIDSLISKGEAVQQTAGTSFFAAPEPVATAQFSEWRSQCLSTLTRVFGKSDPYTISFGQGCKNSYLYDVLSGLGILRAVREDVRDGRLATVREMVHAEVFDDFLEMADYFMSEGRGYKDAAAVIAGGVLEGHLRKLAQKHNIATENRTPKGPRPKKADTLNANLASDGVYNKIQQKIITGWLGIRNDAAHAHYDEYTNDQVTSLIGDVREFISRFPA